MKQAFNYSRLPINTDIYRAHKFAIFISLYPANCVLVGEGRRN